MNTPNKNLEQPLRGSNVGVWDTPMNSNTSILDNALGGTTTIALTNAPVTLTDAQSQCVFINFTGTITGNCDIFFPLRGACYTVEALINNFNFLVTLQTTAAGSQVVCCPPLEAFDIKIDGNTGNVRFRNFGRIGSYMDLAANAVPSWITNCTIPPYLYCNGQAFSGATYPALANLLGATSVPDHRGRARYMANDGTGRITAAGGIDGNTLAAAGGQQTLTIAQANIPNYNLSPPTVATTVGDALFAAVSVAVSGGPTTIVYGPGGNSIGFTATSTASVVNSGGSGTALASLPPGLTGGISLIRAG